MNCIFRSNKHENGCSILYCKCDEKTCKWKHSEQTYLESLHKAHMNHKATHRNDTYLSCVPERWVKRFIAYEQQHE